MLNNLNVYCFYDTISNTFLPQFFMIQNDDVAKRSFKAFVNSPQFPFRDISDDLHIKRVCDFNIEKGVMNVFNNEFLCKVSDLFVKEDEKEV